MSVKVRDYMEKIRTMKFTHTSATTKDVIYLLGGRIMLALETALANVANMFLVAGLIEYTKVSAQAWVAGDTVFWDNTNSYFTNVNGVGLVRAGLAAEGAANPSSTGMVLLDPEAADMVPEVQRLASVATLTTAGVVTYTAAQLLGQLIKRDPNGAARSDVTPTAALIVAAIPKAKIGDCFETTIRNDADAAETITVTAGTGVTLSGTMTIAQNNSKKFLVVLDAVAPGSEAVSIYSIGTFVH